MEEEKHAKKSSIDTESQLHAQIISNPGRMPGELGLFLRLLWAATRAAFG
jgi:hypothetical protein